MKLLLTLLFVFTGLFAIAQEKQYVLLLSKGDHKMWVLDCQGAGIYMDKAMNRMFVSCTPNNYVYVIDLNTHKEIKRIAIGRPDGITSVIVH